MRMRFCRDETRWPKTNALLLSLFLTGALIGTGYYHWSIQQYGAFLQVSLPEMTDSFSWDRVIRTWIGCMRPLLCLFFLRYTGIGILLIPLLFLGEGALLGVAACALRMALDVHELIAVLILGGFRLFLLLPILFMVGNWSLSKGVDSSAQAGRTLIHFDLLLFLIGCGFLTAILESTLCSRLVLLWVEGWI